MTDLRIVVFAYADVGHACLAHLVERRANVVAVYTHADTAGEHRWFPSVRELADANRIPVTEDADFSDLGAVADFAALRPALLLSFYYRALLPRSVTSVPALGAYNMHGSLLPRYRGRAPVNWAVLQGETETGATLHAMVARADAGDIIDQERVPIGPDDTAAEVQARVCDAAVKVLARQLDALRSGTAPRKPQDERQATTVRRRTPADGEFAWSQSAQQIHDLVRAVSHPYPGAFTTLGNDRLTVWRTNRDAPALARTTPGTLVEHGGHLYASCGDGAWIELVTAQLNDEPELTGHALAARLRAASPSPV